MPVIHGAEAVTRNLERLIRGTHILGIPALVTEQYVKGLGPTIARVRSTLEETHGYRPIEKITFSAMRADAFAAQLAALERKHVLIAGVETHVCVLQTAFDLLAWGFDVYVLEDALGARSSFLHESGVARLRDGGAFVACTESVLFEWCRDSRDPRFKAVSAMIKEFA